MKLKRRIIDVFNEDWWDDTELNDVLSSDLEYEGSAKKDLGGAFPKHFFVSKLNNKKYLFKPADDWSPYVEELASRLQRTLMPDGDYVPTIATTLEINGEEKLGSFKPFIDTASSTSKEMTPEMVEQYQKEQVIDWLISNYDIHSDQFISVDHEDDEENKTLAIDRNLGFQFFGDDELDPDYQPYENVKTVYSDIADAHMDGEITLDPNVISPLLDKIESMPDDKFLNIYKNFIDHYEELKPKKSLPTKQEFVKMILNRKNNIKKDFGNYYSDVLNTNVVF